MFFICQIYRKLIYRIVLMHLFKTVVRESVKRSETKSR